MLHMGEFKLGLIILFLSFSFSSIWKYIIQQLCDNIIKLCISSHIKKHFDNFIGRV